MFQLSESSKLQHRYIGAIAALVLISLLADWNGLSSQHEISNSWDGLLWGIADPVLAVDRLVAIAAIGLLSAGVVRGSLMPISFLLAAILGTVINLCQISLPTTEIAVVISSMIFGFILVMPNRPNWLIMLILGAIAGLFQGYVNGESIAGADIIPMIMYILGAAGTQYAIAMSAREIGKTINQGEYTDHLPRTIHFVGIAICALGIVFFRSVIN
jgi:urease accessory protein